MIRSSIALFKKHQLKFIFGATTALITNLSLIMGLYGMANARISIISSILVLALADNVSDSLGIHIFQEAEKKNTTAVWLSTITNFFSRLLSCLVFIALFVFLPLWPAAAISIVFGYCLLIAVTYLIALERGVKPFYAVLEHILIATAVIFISFYLGQLITNGLKL